MLKGTFECLKCDKLYYNLVSPTECPSGKKSHKRKHLKFKEVKYTNELYRLSGRGDGELVIEEGHNNEVIHGMDIKSIANRTEKTQQMQFCFEDLEKFGPKKEHVVQTNLYMFMSGIRKFHLFYVAKNTGQIKTFAIPYDYEKISSYLTEIEDLIKIADKYQLNQLEIGDLPEPCGKKDCKCDTFLTKS